jgi:5,10-methylenetetrahydromethanopterin reductase
MTASFHIGILPNRPLAEFTDWIARADELSFGGVWVADSQSVFRDAFMALTLFAERTTHMELGTAVTNVITRHPAVLAHSFATLDELSGGRAVLGIGIGESAIFNIGQRPARLARLEQVIHVIRELLAGREVEFDGTDLKVSWPPREIPVVIACTGPKSLQMAGRIADGVLFQVGADPILVEYAKRNIELGAKESGRNLSDIKLYQRLACAVSDDRELVRKEARGYASVAAGTIYNGIPRADIPEDLYEDLRIMKEKYDYQQHGNMDADHAGLITDRILDAVGIAGTPDEAIPRFNELIDAGIENFVLPIATREPGLVTDALADKVIPYVNE